MAYVASVMLKLLASQIGLAVIETLKQQQFLHLQPAVLEKLQEGALILQC